MNKECIFCRVRWMNNCCFNCHSISRSEKFVKLLEMFEQRAQSVMYYDEIVGLTHIIQQIDSILTSIDFHPEEFFDEEKHLIDETAKQYLAKAADAWHHLIPIKVEEGENSLYNAIIVLMKNPLATPIELRVRTIVELVTNEIWYTNTFSGILGPIDIAVRTACKNETLPGLYEIIALCNVLRCNIRSIYPRTYIQNEMNILNNLFTPIPSIIPSCTITLLWSHTIDVKFPETSNEITWNPNYLTPLLLPTIINESSFTNHSLISVTTPQKQTFKNNAAARVRIPEFQSSPSRRVRTQANVENDSNESHILDMSLNDKNDEEERHRSQLEKKRERERTRRANRTNNEIEIEREKDRTRARSRRSNQSTEETENQRENDRTRARSRRSNQSTEETENQREKDRTRARSRRSNQSIEETENQREKQRTRSKINRERKKLEKRTIVDENARMDSSEPHRNLNRTLWPEPIPRKLKEIRLQQFLEQMSMSALAESTCAVCNARTSTNDSKKLPLSQIPNTELLKISKELNYVIQQLNTSVANVANNIATRITTTEHIENQSTFRSSSFYYEDGVILYNNGLYKEQNIDMCTLCQKCHIALSNRRIPKFAPANDVWLGDIPDELQGLTIPEEKLISLYRHNSCIIKLQSPFHSHTTAQTALRGNCITFVQNLPNIVNSLPLTLNDLSDTLKVIFIGSRPPQRIHLKKVLTVRKNKIVRALQWLKKFNVLYQSININFETIAQLPEDDIPESIMSTIEQKITDEEVQDERVGYTPDPLLHPKEHITSDVIPIHRSGILDVNGSLISSDEINKYLLTKIKTNNNSNDQIDTENVYLIPHSSKPVNEYFNPKLLASLYPTLFCHGRGAPEDKSRPIQISLQEHIRYLLSYDDRRFERSHSFIFVVFNLLQRRNACFHARLIATKPYFQASVNEIQSLTSKDIEVALENNPLGRSHAQSNSALKKLLQHITTIGGRVMGSTYSRTTLRTQIHSLIYNQGLPSLFVTLNPADVHSPVALYFAGIKLDLDNIQNNQLMDAYRRAEIVASHPVATAKFFHVLVSNILNTMIIGGVLGPVKAYFGTVESQGRGSLHLHLLIWLDHDMKPSDLKEKIQDADFREKLKAYLEDIIKEDLDDFKDTPSSELTQQLNTPTKLAGDSIYTALRGIGISNDIGNASESYLPSTPMRQQWTSSTAYGSPCLSIPYPSPPNLQPSPDLSITYSSPRNLQTSQDLSITYSSPRNLQTSQDLSITYSSPRNLQTSQDLSITYSSPRNLQTSPSISYASPFAKNLFGTPNRDQRTTNKNSSHNQTKLIPACQSTPNPLSPDFATRFRADIIQLVETSNIHKHSDTCYKYWKANRDNKKRCRMRMPRKLIPVSTIDPDTGNIFMRRSHPMINNFNEYLIAACRSNMDIKFIWSGNDAKALVYYITDYVTKMSLSFHDTLTLVQKSMTSMLDSSHPTNKEDALEKSRKLVLRCYNTLASQQELSGVQVASYLMNWDDHYTTHQFEGLYLIQTERYLQAQLNELRSKQTSNISENYTTDDDDYTNDLVDNETNDEEHFQIKSTEKDNNYVLVNSRIDYQYRSDRLNDICLYDFVSILYKKKINATDLKQLSTTEESIEEDNSKEINRRGRPANERYLFQVQHPQVTTHLLMKYSEYRVPVLYGPQIPRQDRDDTQERYNRAILTLFVPWRNVTDICSIHQTWKQAFASRRNLISANSWRIIENIQLLHECKKNRDDHLLQVIAEGDSESDVIDPLLFETNQNAQDEYNDAEDDEDFLDLLGTLDDCNILVSDSGKRTSEKIYIEETVKAVENVGRFDHRSVGYQFKTNKINDQTNEKVVPFIHTTSHLTRLNIRWQQQLKIKKELIRQILIAGDDEKIDDTLDLNTTEDTMVTTVNPINYNTNNCENYGSILPVVSLPTSFPTQTSIADEFTLNKEQRAAFMIITSHLDGDKRFYTDANNGHLIMCVPGCGGTGKSQLIRAITKYFSVTNRLQKMRKVAPTGIAAAEIEGMTIHSFLGEQRNSGKPRNIKPGDAKLEKEWKHVEYLLIDEMSMVGLSLVAKLNRIVCSAKRTDPQIPFGGVNVILFGDCLQYKPVYDLPLHTDFSTAPNKLLTEREIQQRVARSLILQINCVVKLTQQMRTEDVQYLQLLDRLRQGECNQNDYQLLLTRVVGNSSIPTLTEHPWNEASILVFRNEVRTQLNHKAAIHNAREQNDPLMVCVAQDTCQGKPIEDTILIKKLLELSDSKTEHLPSLLPLVPGMPVILTQNIAIELGLINGMSGIFRQLVYETDSVTTNNLSTAFSKETPYVHRPTYALVEISKSKLECNLEELESKLVPISIVEQTFRVDISDIVPRDKRSKSNRKPMLSVKRRALPLVPAYSITTHKSQGQTLSKVVIDLKLPNDTDDIAAIYVPLSRVKRLEDLAILRHFDYKVLSMKPSKSQLAEMERLDKLYLDTRRRFAEWFQ